MAMVKAQKTLGEKTQLRQLLVTSEWAEECFSAANGPEALFIRSKQFGDHGNTTWVCIDRNLFLNSEKSEARQTVCVHCCVAEMNAENYPLLHESDEVGRGS